MISTQLFAALERFCGLEHILVAMDFDGTMAPLVPRAEDARATPGSAAALSLLARLPGTTTALISGRALGSLRTVAEPDERTLLIGSHGAERWFGPEAEPLRLKPEQSQQLAVIVEVLTQVSARHAGTTVELKPASAVLHTREADDEVAALAVAVARRELAALGVGAKDGKRVLEASVLQADKGQGLQLLRQVSGAQGILFAGDDTTDEDGFAVLRSMDVGVKIGAGPSTAEFRLDSVHETAALLETVARLRTRS